MTRDDLELNKFTEQSQVKITGFAANKIINTYDVNGNITLSREYTANRQTTWVDITNGLANNTAFRFYAQDGSGFYVWFNVNGLGVDPAHSGTGIPVLVNSGDSNQVKTQAIVDAINIATTKVKAKFLETYKLQITDMSYGVCSPAVDINSGLQIVTKRSGSAFVLRAETQMTYDGNGNMTEIVRLEH